jgi:hypothetical protein
VASGDGRVLWEDCAVFVADEGAGAIDREIDGGCVRAFEFMECGEDWGAEGGGDAALERVFGVEADGADDVEEGIARGGGARGGRGFAELGSEDGERRIDDGVVCGSVRERGIVRELRDEGEIGVASGVVEVLEVGAAEDFVM